MSIKRLGLLIALGIFIAFGAYSISKVPKHLEYAFLPSIDMTNSATQAAQSETSQGEQEENPKEKPPTALENRLKELSLVKKELKDSVPSMTLFCYYEGATLSHSGGGSLQGQVIGLWGDVDAMERSVLLAGRQLYPDELFSSHPVAVIDEKTAVELFRDGAPIDRAFSFAGVEFKVVGVIRHRRTAGERWACRAMVPLCALDGANQNPTLAVVSGAKAAGGRARSTFFSKLSSFREGGANIDLQKERDRSFLPLRLTICILLLFVLLLIWKLIKFVLTFFIRRTRTGLQKRYFLQEFWQIALRTLASLALLGIWFFALYLVLQELIKPVLLFPEWVPSVPVEPKEMSAAFWQNRSANTALVALRTPNSLLLSFWLSVSAALCTAFGLISLPLLTRIKDAWTAWLKNR